MNTRYIKRRIRRFVKRIDWDFWGSLAFFGMLVILMFALSTLGSIL